MAYTGKEWDISAFIPTQFNIAAMERDSELLFESIIHAAYPAETYYNWVGRFVLDWFTAMVKGNVAVDNACKHGFYQLRNECGWKLSVLSVVILSAQYELLHAWAGKKSPPKSFVDVAKDYGIRDPQTADERTYSLAAYRASEIMNRELNKALRASLERNK